MSPFSTGNLIRCDCGHAVNDHSDAGCGAVALPCACLKTPATIVIDEIAELRPEWIHIPASVNV
jgi:hypothetical protein